MTRGHLLQVPPQLKLILCDVASETDQKSGCKKILV